MRHILLELIKSKGNACRKDGLPNECGICMYYQEDEEHEEEYGCEDTYTNEEIYELALDEYVMTYGEDSLVEELL